MDRDEGCGAGVPAADARADTVLNALAAIRSSIDVVVAAAGGWRSDALARDGVREGFCVLQAMHAAWLSLVADLDCRPEAVPRARAGTVAQTFLRAGLRRTAEQAAADVRA